VRAYGKDSEQETGPRPIDERKLVPKQQFGFRKNHSTIDNTLNTHITEAIRKREYTAVLSLDLSKALLETWYFENP
jgi:hypothetical protein